MTILDRIARFVAFDLKESSEFPADYHAFRSRVDNLIPEALDWAAPDDFSLLSEWAEAGHPGSDLPTRLPVIETIRWHLETLISTCLDPWEVLWELADYLPVTAWREISATQEDDPEAFFNLMVPHFRRPKDAA